MYMYMYMYVPGTINRTRRLQTTNFCITRKKIVILLHVLSMIYPSSFQIN